MANGTMLNQPISSPRRTAGESQIEGQRDEQCRRERSSHGPCPTDLPVRFAAKGSSGLRKGRGIPGSWSSVVPNDQKPMSPKSTHALPCRRALEWTEIEHLFWKESCSLGTGTRRCVGEMWWRARRCVTASGAGTVQECFPGRKAR